MSPRGQNLRSKMKCVATLVTESKNPMSVAESLNIDNLELDNLIVKTKRNNNKILTTIESNNLGTMLNVIDDIIRCQIVAESVIK